MGSQLEVTNTFRRALAGEPVPVPPIWLMRQAGRYHSPYRKLRESYSFEELCKVPELSAEVAMGPIRDFDFDAAILFSDLLFPLAALGMALSYDEGPPVLDGPLDERRIAAFRPLDEAAPLLGFQAEGVAATRALLPSEKGLIGFVGGPWTLFVYAMEGAHSGAMRVAKSSWDVYRQFEAHAVPLIGEAIRMQLAAGADLVMMLDTAAGDLPPSYFDREVAPAMTGLARAFPGRLGYYAKASHPALMDGRLADAPWAGFGYDSRWDLAAVLDDPHRTGFVQGNFDPAWLFLPPADLRNALLDFLRPIAALETNARRGWICGLGHGVLPGTPEEAVRTFVTTVREVLS
jgi:uroporphyrinogen decarboxylase